ncbi:MAG: beta-lactamase family protein [Acidobacteria bacterium]|nr:beta-lactamase family protein [Acidobacteriota bacterium]
MTRRLLVVLTAAAALGAAVNSGLDAERLARIAPRMKQFAERGQIAGAVTLVARHGQIAHLAASGWQDVEGKKPMKTDSIFQVMSMTKPVTAVAIMMLAEQGKLAVSDPVERHLPEFRGQMMLESRTEGEVKLRKPARPITIRDLMTHTSGMSGQLPAGAPDLYTKMNRSLAEAVLLFSQQPLEFEPGSKWQYSNSGIATLGRIIEVTSGEPYETFIAKKIFEPLGMKDSFFFPPEDKTGRIALVYRSENGKLSRADGTILGGNAAEYRKGAKYPAPEFGLYTTATDLAAFYQMMLDGGAYKGKRLLSPASVETMSRVHTAGIGKVGWLPGGSYGLAWEVIAEPLGTATLMSLGTYFHGGAFGTHGWIDSKKDLVGVYLVQRTSGGDDARNAFMAMTNAAVE